MEINFPGVSNIDDRNAAPGNKAKTADCDPTTYFYRNESASDFLKLANNQFELRTEKNNRFDRKLFLVSFANN